MIDTTQTATQTATQVVEQVEQVEQGASNVKTLTNKSKATAGEILLKIKAMGTTDKETGEKVFHPNLIESKCLSVPVLSDEVISNHFVLLIPVVRELLQGGQKEICRSIILRTGATSIPRADFGITKVIQYLNESLKGNAFTSEYIKNWFDESYEALYLTHFQAKGWNETLCFTRMNAIRNSLAEFTGNYKPTGEIAKKILNIIAMIDEGEHDGLMSSVKQRCENVQKELLEKEDALGWAE